MRRFSSAKYYLPQYRRGNFHGSVNQQCGAIQLEAGLRSYSRSLSTAYCHFLKSCFAPRASRNAEISSHSFHTVTPPREKPALAQKDHLWNCHANYGRLSVFPEDCKEAPIASIPPQFTRIQHCDRPAEVLIPFAQQGLDKLRSFFWGQLIPRSKKFRHGQARDNRCPACSMPSRQRIETDAAPASLPINQIPFFCIHCGRLPSRAAANNPLHSFFNLGVR